MNVHRHPLVALLALLVGAASSAAALAQSTLPSAAASAPVPSKSASAAAAPRLMSPAEKRSNADLTAAPESRPERPVVPQLTVPLGRKPAPPHPVVRTPMVGTVPHAAGGVDDAAARCDAIDGKQSRIDCEARARARPKTP